MSVVRSLSVDIDILKDYSVLSMHGTCIKIFNPAPSDYNSASGNFDMTDSNTVQCIPIAVISDNTTEPPDECFTFTTSTSSLAGLTLSPTAATVCISDEQSEKYTLILVVMMSLANYIFCSGSDHWTATVLLFHCGGPGTSGSLYCHSIW